MVKTFEWAVVGAGPAGIAAVGKLIDRGVKPENIAWVDPTFKVGDLGNKWREVSSNTSVKLFWQFLKTCKAFNYDKAPPFEIEKLAPEKTCLLRYIADPLQWVTDHLCETVTTFKSEIHSLEQENQLWYLKGHQKSFSAKSVILALGAQPKKLNFPNLKEIPLEQALDKSKLPNLEGETVAVFGASHSAMIVLQNLLSASAKKVINFYQSPLKFAVFFEDWILFDNTGLKGQSAEWARRHILGKLPENLERVQSSDPEFHKILAQCQSVVYTIGFERRALPKVHQMGPLTHNEYNGIIAPGLFGLGIGFPQRVEDCYGNVEYNVGLWKFMLYLDKVLPLWTRYGLGD
ncbi:MAG: NAD(P)-binding domain-containing protein [Bdellovibrionales bacterium]|nr:NAD(P)-binding domain-containing protein [Bdellovibrionales bacterium]MCB1076020.1 NAD(P)-binding domain-containing protein [Simkania sp.]MCP5491189.1 NAD(P)-binding domain-containing protein [Chlamydiales bacterium]